MSAEGVELAAGRDGRRSPDYHAQRWSDLRSRPRLVDDHPVFDRLNLTEVCVRNWSRTARALDDDLGAVFVKQFVNAAGRPLPALFDAELAALAELGRAELATIRPMVPLAISRRRLTIAYRWIDDLVPLTIAAFQADRAAQQRIVELIDRLVGDLGELARQCPYLPTRSIRGASGPFVADWKGLDLANLAAAPSGGVYVFDLGPLALAPRSHPVARLVASMYLANWGTPIRRCLGGPAPWAAVLDRSLRDHTTDRQIIDRVERSLNVRCREPQRRSIVGRFVAQAASQTLAPRYLGQVCTAVRSTGDPSRCGDVPVAFIDQAARR
jgi:hypothetical protein